MNRRSPWALVGLLAIAVGMSFIGDIARGQEIRNYVVLPATAVPQIDGMRSPGEWDFAAAPTGDFTLLRTAGDASSENIQFQAAWDADFLYFIIESDYANWSPAGEGPLDFNQDNVNFYIDPNTDLEDNAGGSLDGYQIAFQQRQGPSSHIQGTAQGTGIFQEAHINTGFGNNSGWQGLRNSVMMQNNGPDGGVMEVAFSWSDFDATNAEDQGLVHTFPAMDGETWFFQLGRITTNPANFLPVWQYTPQQSFTFRPHGELTFAIPEPGMIGVVAVGAVVAARRARRRR